MVYKCLYAPVVFDPSPQEAYRKPYPDNYKYNPNELLCIPMVCPDLWKDEIQFNPLKVGVLTYTYSRNVTFQETRLSNQGMATVMPTDPQSTDYGASASGV